MRITLIILFLIARSVAHGGQDAGNGGNLIVCVPSQANQFQGNYSLDFLLTAETQEPVQVSTIDGSLDRIATLLKAKVPELYRSFRAFRDDLFNTSYSKLHVWEKAPFGLTRLDDQNIIVRLPPNCVKGDEPHLVQAIVRLNPDFSGSETQIFKYMPMAIDSIKDRPLQLSFLLIHEWLWELSKNVDRNRRINAYFHSVAFDQHTAVEVLSELRGMGLRLEGTPLVFDGLQEALDRVQPNATLILANQEYKDHVVIRKPVRIRALDGSKHPKMTGQLEIVSSDVEIENLRFEPSSGALSHGVLIKQGSRIRVHGCQFNQASVLVTSRTSALLYNNTFSRATIDVNASSNLVGEEVVLGIQKSSFAESETAVNISGGGHFNISINDNAFSRNRTGIYIFAPFDMDFVYQVSGNTFNENEVGIARAQVHNQYAGSDKYFFDNNIFRGNTLDLKSN